MQAPDFIEVHDDALDAACCRALVAQFESCWSLFQRAETLYGAPPR